MTETGTPDVSSPRPPALGFVVSTGRCGSTILGDLLADHPSAATINEYLISVEPDPLPTEKMTGSAFAQLLSRPHPAMTLLLRHGIEPAELRYPIDRPGARFTRFAGVPAVLVAALPATSRAPDDAWDELLTEITTWPASDGPGHYRHLGQWFAARAGATTVIERSGGSLRYVSKLVRSFPDARFVHIHRPGPATALSMAEHPFFQISALRRRVLRETGHDLLDDALSLPVREEIDRVAPGLTPWAFDVAMFRSRPPVSAAEFGLLWSSLLYSGIRALSSLPNDQVLHVDYETFCRDTRSQLVSVARFLDLDPRPGWLESSVARVHPPRERRAVSDDRLERSCAPGEAVRRVLIAG